MGKPPRDGAAGYTVEIADLAGITCIADPNGAGTMGVHYLNPALLDDAVNATTPELLIYEPQSNGTLRLVAVEYLVLKADWEATNGATAFQYRGGARQTPASPGPCRQRW